MTRSWAFWRRAQYASGFLLTMLLVGTGIYFGYLHTPASCFDGTKNGDERGIDCGGACSRVCAPDVLPVQTLWTKEFRITDGQYNVVAYIENKNIAVGATAIPYTFTLYDGDGVVAERSGVTVLPPDSVYPIFEGRIQTNGRRPTETILELGEPEAWVRAETGREQFVVESRELQDIDSTPRLDATITNTALTEASDVEIVATIFDSRGNPLTASRTIVPNFASRATERVVFTWPEPIEKTIRSCSAPTDVLLAIDLSGSMNDDGDTPPEPITSVLAAASSFVNRLRSDDQAGVVSYASEAAIQQQLTDAFDVVAETITGLSIDPREESGSTNIGDAIISADAELNSPRSNDDARNVLVLLTDGQANAPGVTPEEYAITAAEELKSKGAELFTIGLGERANEPFLRAIASGEGYYFNAPGVSTIDRIYRSVTDAICEDGAAVIEIIAKTDSGFAPSR